MTSKNSYPVAKWIENPVAEIGTDEPGIPDHMADALFNGGACAFWKPPLCLVDRDRQASSMLKAFQEAIADGYIDKDSHPLMCDGCGGKDFYHVTIDTINGILCEGTTNCSGCDRELAWYSYGHTLSRFTPFP